jgi:hypothetical protein
MALPAVALFARGNWVKAGALLGVAAWFQALVGVLTAGALGLVAMAEIARAPDPRANVSRAAMLAGVFVAVASPLLVPVLLAPGLEDPAQYDPFYVMAQLRVPHHYLPSSFGIGAWLRFAALCIAGAAAGWMLWRSNRLQHGRFVISFLAAVLAIGLVGLLFAEVIPVLAVAELQPFKLSVLAATFLSLLVGHAAAGLVPDRIREVAMRLAWHPRAWIGVVAFAGLTAALAIGGVGRPAAVYTPRQYAAGRLDDAERWVRHNTHPDALFAIPPSNTTFRVHARRSVVVNFKPVPFQEGGAGVWLDRLLDVAPAPLPLRGGFAWQRDLDAAYGQNDLADWTRLTEHYGLDYALVDRESVPPGSRVVYRNADWAVLDFGPPATPRSAVGGPD